MADIPRLNGVIRALEAGKCTFTSFCQADPDTAIAMATAKYDGIVYEMEHNPWDIRALRDSLQYMLNRGQIAKSGSVAPTVTPMVRIPPNGAEKAKALLRRSSSRFGSLCSYWTKICAWRKSTPPFCVFSM